LKAVSSQRSRLEAALLRDRWWIGASLIASVLLCWAWIVPMARDMYGSMQGPSSWMMVRSWDAWHTLLLFAMWQVMMAGMMLPSAAPTLLLYANVIRKSDDGLSVNRRVHAFALGYLLAWGAFSLVATLLQRVLGDTRILTAMMQLHSHRTGGVLLIVAGAYQFTPLKQSCLQSCRSPAAFIARYWRRGAAGAVRMGLEHGLYCVGCCWALMLLLFVGGVMNLYWIAAITVAVLIEKLAPMGVQGGRLSGAGLLAAGVMALVTGG
jgi:predicted metal-binding membrane protein